MTLQWLLPILWFPVGLISAIPCSLVSLHPLSRDSMQLVQNSLAKVIFPSSRKFDHVTPRLSKLHWLPIEHRIIFKIAVITFKVLHNKQPAYLLEMVTPHQSSRNLRSNSQYLLDPPAIKLAIPLVGPLRSPLPIFGTPTPWALDLVKHSPHSDPCLRLISILKL